MPNLTSTPFACASCRGSIRGTPLIHLGLAFCCAGCAAGGPCTCSYDEEADAMLNHDTATTTARARRWPMTAEARQALIDEIARLKADLATAAGMGDNAVTRVHAGRTARRLEQLQAVLDAAEVDEAADRARIGRRATLREEDGAVVSYAIVFPGDGDPMQGWLSADSPMGAAVLDAAPGDVVEVQAPAGRRKVAVVAVD